MKSLKMPLTALAIFAIVGGALAFNTAKVQLGTVYCFTTAPNPALQCAGQPTGVQEAFTVVSGGEPSPCTGSAVPYETSVSGNTCTNVSGDTFAPTGE